MYYDARLENSIIELLKDIYILTFDTCVFSVAHRYEQFGLQISQMESETNARFFVINSQFLKEDVMGHCEQWQTRLCQLLFNLVCDHIESMYQYTVENGNR